MRWLIAMLIGGTVVAFAVASGYAQVEREREARGVIQGLRGTKGKPTAMLVTDDPKQPPMSQERYDLSLDDKTRFEFSDHKPATAADLAVGQKVTFHYERTGATRSEPIIHSGVVRLITIYREK
jgi:hypothetical protein